MLVASIRSCSPEEHLRAPSAAIMSAGAHVGILYRLDDEPVQLLHLAWHFRLQNDTDLPEDLHWGHLADLSLDDEPENISSLTAYLGLIAAENPNVPYGLSDHGVEFTPDGKIVWDGEGGGLTCATFVLAVLRAQGFEPLDQSTWGDADLEDIEFQECVVKALANRDAVRAEAVAEDIGCVRFTPKQVVGCCVQSKWPHNWEAAKHLSVLISNDLI